MAKTILNDTMKDDIFNALVVDDLTIKETAKRVGVAEKTIYAWVKDSEDFGKFLARTREAKAHKLINRAENMIGELESLDTTELNRESAKVQVNIKRAAFDMYLRLAGKYNRQVYGEKVDTDVTSGGKEIKQVAIVPNRQEADKWGKK